MGVNVQGFVKAGEKGGLILCLSVCLSDLCIFSFGRGSEEAIGNLASDRV